MDAIYSWPLRFPLIWRLPGCWLMASRRREMNRNPGLRYSRLPDNCGNHALRDSKHHRLRQNSPADPALESFFHDQIDPEPQGITQSLLKVGKLHEANVLAQTDHYI